MRHYAYIADGVLVERFEQAERISDAPVIDATGWFSNATDLDDFYITAQSGVDHETGEVIDLEREAATRRDISAYVPLRQTPSLADLVNILDDIIAYIEEPDPVSPIRPGIVH